VLIFDREGIEESYFLSTWELFAGQNRRFWRKVQNCHEVIFGLSHLRRGQNLFQVANFWQLRAEKFGQEYQSLCSFSKI